MKLLQRGVLVEKAEKEEEEGRERRVEHFADEVVSGFLTPHVLSPHHHIGAAE